MSFGGGPGENSSSTKISTRPLLKHGYLEITAPSDYKNLLVIMNDPDTILYIRDIVVAMDDDGGVGSDPKPFLNVFLNGTPYVKDANMYYYYAGFGFGGSLEMYDNHKPIIIQVKTVGTGTLYATAYVTGIIVPKSCCRK